jgi:drug/metabolite transporter (DMT)-like permease
MGIPESTIGMTAALGSAASWALGSVLFKRISAKMSPMAMTLAKGVLACIFLAIVAILYRQFALPGKTELLFLTLSGLLGIAVGDTLFFAALSRLTPLVLVLFMMLGHVATAALGVVILGERPPFLVWVGLACVLAGVGTVLCEDIMRDKSEAKNQLAGYLFGALAMACFSSSIIIAKPALESVPTVQGTLLRMVAGTIGILLVGAGLRRLGGWLTPLASPREFASFCGATAVVTFGGFWLSLVGIKYCAVAVANTLGATEPLFTLPLTWFVLRDRVRIAQIVGTAVSVAGIIIVYLNQ